MTYTAVIVEDNPIDAEILQDYLLKYFPEITIAAITDSVRQVKQLLLQHQPQLVFMDIELTDGKSLELQGSFDTTDMQLIFITSHSVFAIDAIRANAVDYIVKPIDSTVLKRAVVKAFGRIEQNRVTKANAIHKTNRITVPTADGASFIDVEKIVRVEADGSYAKVVLADGKTIFVTRRLGQFEDELPANLFMRVHKSYLINRLFITDFIKSKTGSIKMTDGFTCPLGVGQKEDIILWVEGRK